MNRLQLVLFASIFLASCSETDLKRGEKSISVTELGNFVKNLGAGYQFTIPRKSSITPRLFMQIAEGNRSSFIGITYLINYS